MSDFTKYSNYNENTSHSSVVFGANSPLLEVELNELQQIIQTKFSRVTNVLGSGIIPLADNSLSFSTSSLTLTVSKAIIIDKSGLTAYVDSASVVMSTTNRKAYFEIQEVDADKDTVLKSYGNTSGGEVSNTMIDSRTPIETTKRKIVTYTLKVSQNVPSDTDTIKNVLVGTYASSLFTPEPWGLLSPTFKNSISMGRKASTTIGTNSVALGTNVTASGNYSFAHGEGSTASGLRSVALGYNATASSSHTFAVGNGSKATNTGAYAEGADTTASGIYSHAEGEGTTASDEAAHSEGYKTTALKNQHATGHHNDTSVALANELSGATTGTAFVIGNGTNSAKSNAFRVQSDGSTYAKGAYNATGADYAEYFEWADENPQEEDRRGYFVTFDETAPNKIRKANANDYILGVVSANPCVIGSSDEAWRGRYVFDDFGAFIYETVEETIERIDEETGEVTTETIQAEHYKLNPNYDETLGYTPRSERPEWATIGLIGTLYIVDDTTCVVGGYCKCSENGVATASESGYRVIERVNENIIKAIIK